MKHEFKLVSLKKDTYDELRSRYPNCSFDQAIKCLLFMQHDQTKVKLLHDLFVGLNAPDLWDRAVYNLVLSYTKSEKK